MVGCGVCANSSGVGLSRPQARKTEDPKNGPAARARAMGRIMPFHVPLVPPGIGRAEVRSQERIRIMNSEW